MQMPRSQWTESFGQWIHVREKIIIVAHGYGVTIVSQPRETHMAQIFMVSWIAQPKILLGFRRSQQRPESCDS